MFDKFELARTKGTLVPGTKDIYKIGEDQYVILDNPYQVIINTSMTVKTKEENQKLINQCSKIIIDALIKQELIRRGEDPADYF